MVPLTQGHKNIQFKISFVLLISSYFLIQSQYFYPLKFSCSCWANVSFQILGCVKHGGEQEPSQSCDLNPTRREKNLPPDWLQCLPQSRGEGTVGGEGQMKTQTTQDWALPVSHGASQAISIWAPFGQVTGPSHPSAIISGVQ